MPAFKLPMVRENNRSYNCIGWQNDTPNDRKTPLRAYVRLSPAIEQWMEDYRVDYAISMSRHWVNDNPTDSVNYDFAVHIEDDVLATIFKLIWL